MQVLVNVLLVINVFVCVALIAVVLLQRSEGGALGMGGGGGPGGFMTARGAGDLLTRVTWILAFSFFLISITLTVLTGRLHGGVGSLVDHINVNSLDLSTPPNKTASAPTTPSAPSATTPVLPAPTPQAQTSAPAKGEPDPLSALAAPSLQSKVLPAPAPQPQTKVPDKK